MTLHFGLALDDSTFPIPAVTTGGLRYAGPQGLLRILETYLGLSGHPNDNEYLRVEQYRQALLHHLSLSPDAFYQASFAADQFATAAELLSRRDELLLAGWDFAPADALPDRLACLAEIEAFLRSPGGAPDEATVDLSPGFADRFMAVLALLPKRRHPIRTVRLVEPFELLPQHWQGLLAALQDDGVRIEAAPAYQPATGSDLGKFRQSLLEERKEKMALTADGSLLIIKGKRETDLAVFAAQLIRENPAFRPLCLIPEKSRTLDNCLIQEGLPSMGILSASLARPTLQVLKLVTVFLWHPIDPYKIMEFVSLAVKPLDNELANRIAAHMAQSPGLNSDSWYAMLFRYLEKLEERAKYDPSVKPAAVERQFRFWFDRRRYDVAQKAPKEEVSGIFDYLRTWAFQAFEDGGSKNQSLIVLGEQAKKITELLAALPETQLSQLELERIVRTIYEPAPVQFKVAELGLTPYVNHAAAVNAGVEELLWWNFIQKEKDHFFSRWYRHERDYLAAKNIALIGPAEENALLVWQRKHPVLSTRKRLVLVIPELVSGTEVHPHPLSGDLEATFSNLADVTININHAGGREMFRKHFRVPDPLAVAGRQLGKPQAFIRIAPHPKFDRREEETFSSLDALFYYPYQWLFRHKILLRKSSILSVVPDHTLMGNLAHRFFEKLFQEEQVHTWDKSAVERWIDAEVENLLSREGAVLLMYGREPEKIAFTKRVKYSAWSLVNLIQSNGWRIKSTEEALQGKFLDLPINGRADLVLEKNGEIAVIDLKWRGAAHRERTIRNEEDLQLVLYSRLLSDNGTPAHTAYFIMENGKMIARNELAFKNITAVAPDTDHLEVSGRIMQRMESTYHWRMEQIRQGQIEIRCQQTCPELEAHYGEALLDVLEMKNEDSRFDDYRTLINLNA